MFVISNHIKYNLNTLITDNIRYVREFLAETLGTFALVLFGDGAVAQVKRLNVLLFFVVFSSSTNSIMFPGRSWQGGKERRFLRRFPQHMSGIWLCLDDWDLHQVGRSPVPQPTGVPKVSWGTRLDGARFHLTGPKWPLKYDISSFVFSGIFVIPTHSHDHWICLRGASL